MLERELMKNLHSFGIIYLADIAVPPHSFSDGNNIITFLA